MAEIEHIVYLMLENRSLDSGLGWLDDDEPPPSHFRCDDPAPTYDGLDAAPHGDTDRRGRWHPAVKGTGGRLNVPSFDPYEPHEHVTRQLFETRATSARGGSWSGSSRAASMPTSPRSGIQMPPPPVPSSTWQPMERCGRSASWSPRGVSRSAGWRWASQGNEYHPPFGALAGEHLLKQVYDARTADPATWRRVL